MTGSFRSDLPGPAFIQFTGLRSYDFDPLVALLDSLVAINAQAHAYDIPEGYIWQNATNHTPAGWVRPCGKKPAPPEAVPNSG